MAFFRESMTVGETEMLEIERIKEEDDPYLQTALDSVYDDTTTLVRGAEVVPERMRMGLLATEKGHPVIGIESDGVKYAYDYDPTGEYAKDHYAKLEGYKPMEQCNSFKTSQRYEYSKKGSCKKRKNCKICPDEFKHI